MIPLRTPPGHEFSAENRIEKNGLSNQLFVRVQATEDRHGRNFCDSLHPVTLTPVHIRLNDDDDGCAMMQGFSTWITRCRRRRRRRRLRLKSALLGRGRPNVTGFLPARPRHRRSRPGGPDAPPREPLNRPPTPPLPPPPPRDPSPALAPKVGAATTYRPVGNQSVN